MTERCSRTNIASFRPARWSVWKNSTRSKLPLAFLKLGSSWIARSTAASETASPRSCVFWSSAASVMSCARPCRSRPIALAWSGVSVRLSWAW